MDISIGLKKIELDILKEFIRVCHENNHRYYLVGGTALGAIRHHGFIPWDDDIDVGLPREDYNKFLSIAQSSFPEYYFLQTFITDPDYPLNFAKIRDNRTTFIESSMKKQRINHGVFIDVFPLDYYPEKRENWFMFIDLLHKARISAEFSSIASVKMRALQTISKIIYPNLKKTVKKRDKHIQSVKNSTKIYNFCGAWREKETMPSEFFQNGVPAQFEDIVATVPANYDSYLRHLYGDYMTPPPHEKQVSHHSTEVIDLNKPYKEYVR